MRIRKSQENLKKYAQYIQTMWNLVKLTSCIFIVDHACETMHKANKTGALLRRLAFMELSAGPLWGGGTVWHSHCENPDPQKDASVQAMLADILCENCGYFLTKLYLQLSNGNFTIRNIKNSLLSYNNGRKEQKKCLSKVCQDISNLHKLCIIPLFLSAFGYFVLHT